MKRWVAYLFLLSGSLGGYAQINRIDLLSLYTTSPSPSASVVPKSVSGKNPHLQSQSEIVNLGYLRQAVPVEKEIIFTNSGQSPLFIKGITSASRSHLEVISFDQRIDPKGVGRCTVRIYPDKKGTFSHYLTVLSNADNYVEVVRLAGTAY
jgi:hypothetical protein